MITREEFKPRGLERSVSTDRAWKQSAIEEACAIIPKAIDSSLITTSFAYLTVAAHIDQYLKSMGVH
jgi:hypothetical protein